MFYTEIRLLILFLPTIRCAVHVIDLTVWQGNRYVDVDSSTNSEYRGYVSTAYKDTTTFTIGRTSNTGTGYIGTEIVNPEPGPLPDGAGFPVGSTVGYSSASAFRRINIKLSGANNNKERVGAFYVTAVANSGEAEVNITTIKTAQQATIKPVDHIFTKTASIGDVVTLEVETNSPDLRWSHNGGPIISEWNDKKQITILNVRKADEGIYECFQDDMRGSGVHAIMRLIVRSCSKSKFGSNCNSSCTTCYNGGVCKEDTGTCVCRPGFQGLFCQIACGLNNWGADCSIICDAMGDCKGAYFCVPDPVGCSCMTGFYGKTCKEGCPDGRYGADCEQTCHCTEGCSKGSGCTKSDKCDIGFSGPQCQEASTCASGLFGVTCEYQCHCYGNADCNKSSGQCSNGCAEGWGDSDCQQALPALYTSPTTGIVGNNASVFWKSWNFDIDYGTGPVKEYKVYVGEHGSQLTDWVVTTETRYDFVDLKPETQYDFAVSVLRSMEESPLEGDRTATVSNTTKCGVPTLSPTISNTTDIGPTSLEIHWTVPPGDDWIKCSKIVSFIITYNTQDSPDEKTNIYVNDSSARHIVIDNIDTCTTYEFVICVTNTDYQGPNSETSLANPTPVDKVTFLDVTPVSYDALNVSWGKPTTQCEITSYFVGAQLILLDQCLPQDVNIKSMNTSITHVTLERLEPFSTYNISVNAISGEVTGAFDIIEGRTGELVPTGHPSNIVIKSSLHTLAVTWDPPSCGSRHGNITKYEYVFGRDIDEDVFNGTTQSDMITFENLKTDTVYELKIRAATIVGPGTYTNLTRMRTEAKFKDKRPAFSITITATVIFGVLLLIGGIMYYRYRKAPNVYEALRDDDDEVCPSLSMQVNNDEPRPVHSRINNKIYERQMHV